MFGNLAFFLDPDQDTRMRLKGVTHTIPQIKKLYLAGDDRQALDEISKPDLDLDVIFISSKFPDNVVSSYIKKAKSTKAGVDSAYVLTLKANDQNASFVAKSLALGVDGFLLEPFSAEGLEEIMVLALKIKKARKEEREQALLQVLIADSFRFVDKVSQSILESGEAGPDLPNFRKTKEAILGLEEHLVPQYVKMVKNFMRKLEESEPCTHNDDNSLSSKERGKTATERLQEKLLSRGLAAEIEDLPDSLPQEPAVAPPSSRFYHYKKEIATVEIDSDMVTAEALNQLVEAVTERVNQGDKAIIFDFAKVKCLNNFGVKKLLECQDIAKSKKSVLVTKALKGFVREVYEIFQLDKVIPEKKDSP